MADNYTKLPLQKSLNAMATTRAMAAIERSGQALPCRVTAVNGSLVTVKFEVNGDLWTLPPLTLPKAESQWLRAPTQIGDFGITVPADTYLGGVSGFGGVADLTVDYANMSTLVWVPIASSAFSAAPDPNKAFVNGPKGSIIGDSALGCYAEFDAGSGTITIATGGDAGLLITATPSALTINVGGKTWTFASTGLTDDAGVVLETHQHGGVESGSDVSGPPEA